MLWLIWVVCALVALLWTGAAALLAAGIGWTAQALASGAATDLAAAVGSWQLPAWVVAWFDLQWLTALQSLVVQAVDALQTFWPGAGQVVGWLVPVVWVGWGFGMALLLLLAALAHWLVRRGSRPPPSAPVRPSVA
jgi:hypothetical protein